MANAALNIEPTPMLALNPGALISSCALASAASACGETHSIFLGTGATVPRIHIRFSPRVTFHRPGPGWTPATTVTVSSSRISGVVVAAAAAPCAAGANVKARARAVRAGSRKLRIAASYPGRSS